MKIKVVCKKNNSRKTPIKKAVSILNSVQNYFYFKLCDDEERDVSDDILVDWNTFCNRNNTTTGEHIIYITEKPFNDNWFSHENNSYAIITTYDWEGKFAPPSLRAYTSYQIAQAAICFEADLSEDMEMRMAHDKAKGCMFDFCWHKDDIKLGMVAGTICPRCCSVLHQYGVDRRAINAIERMLQSVRYEAIGKPQIIDENQAFIVMRFSKNDESDNAYKYGILPALKDLGIKDLRADNTITSGQLLEKIEKAIERSRFVIAKIDSDNLNVYFELGLAMGLDKDVLLISERDLLLQLPSDLRNWECLTYTKGDYESLKNEIMKFYRDNFHY